MTTTVLEIKPPSTVYMRRYGLRSIVWESRVRKEEPDLAVETDGGHPWRMYSRVHQEFCMTRWFSRGEDDLHQSVKATLISITSSFWNKRRMYDNEKNIQPNEGNNGLRKRMMMKYNDRLDEEWCSWFCSDNHITRSSRRLFSLSFFFFSLWPPMISHKKKDLNILDGNHHAWSSFDDSLSSLS